VITNALEPSLIRRLAASLVIVLVTYLPAAHGQAGEDAAKSSLTLSGNVINSVTREPVPRALVYTPDNRFAMFTDDQGHFEFKIVFPSGEKSASGLQPNFFGPTTLTARKPGFLENESQSSIEPDSRDVTLTLVPEALIVGRVNVPAANQADRITVEAYQRQVSEGRARWVSVGSVRTRSNGEFRIANLRAGTYKLFTGEMLDRDPLTFDPQGQAYGYPPIYYPAASDFGSAAPIVLEAGKTLQVELSPVLQAYYPIQIAIANGEAGAPIAVSVARQGNKGPGYSLGYEGESITGALPNGTYTVEAVRQGQPPASGVTTITVRGAPLMNAAITLLPGGLIPVNVRTELRPGSRRENPPGIVSSGGFTRQQTVYVSLEPADEFNQGGGAWPRPPQQNNDNALVLQGVRPGRYWVKVSPYRGEEYVASVVSNGVDLLHNPLVVGPGGASGAIDVVLRDDSGALDGMVDGVTRTARPPAGFSGEPGAVSVGSMPPSEVFYVYCIPLADSPGHFSQGTVSSDGSFHIPNLAPGAYRVLAFDRPQPELEYLNPEAMSAYEGKGPVVRVAPGGSERVRLTLIRSSE